MVPTPTDPPVFAPLVPPTNFVYSKKLGVCGIAANTGNHALIVACSSLLVYAIGAKQ